MSALCPFLNVVVCTFFNIDGNSSPELSDHINENRITPRNDLWKPLKGENSIVDVLLFVLFHCSF